MESKISPTKELLERCACILSNDKQVHFDTGDSFNLFDLLVSGNEELMHSSFIASLLDPKGKHSQGSVFLKLFLKNCGIHDDFDADSAYVTCEKDIGRKSGSGEEATGGRIDIFLEDKLKHRIIIENKWDAEDQADQLIRYHNYDPNSIILYLTRYGHMPSRDSIGYKLKDREDYFCISYSKEITTWLKDCVKAVDKKAYISVAIDSYRKLITRLNMTGEDNRILEEIRTSKETISAAFKISEALGELKKKGQIFFWTELFNRISDNNELNPEVCTHQIVSQNIDDIIPAIRLYVDKGASMEKYRLYGIRCQIGRYLGENVYAAILVDTNIYYPIFVPGNIEFNKKAYEYFKDSGWIHYDFENIALKRPGNNEKFNFLDFNSEDVYSLALGDTTLVDYIYNEFLETVKIARHNLNSFVNASE